MNNELTFEAFMMAEEHDRFVGNCPRHAHDWFKLYQIAAEQVAKYGLDGSGIPLGAKVMRVDLATISVNPKRGYRGVCGPSGILKGFIEDKHFPEKMFAVHSSRYGNDDSVSCIWRSCWFRLILVIDEECD